MVFWVPIRYSALFGWIVSHANKISLSSEMDLPHDPLQLEIFGMGEQTIQYSTRIMGTQLP
jgi:hypothetical protein